MQRAEKILSSLRELLYQYKEYYAWSVKDAHAGLREKGAWFEKLCRYFFKNDPIYKQRFDDVWLWQDWPGRDNMPDTGIDIVAKLKNSEGFCAIQCKFYEPWHCISKADIDSFITASDKTIFAERILVSVADDWGRNAENAIKGLHVRYDKSVQSYTKLYYLYYGTLTICLPVSSNPILLMLLSFGAALHRL